jgi:hypothetical protein
VALPRPASERRVFRPARRVNWATRVFAVLVLILAIVAIGAVVEVVLPQRVGTLAGLEANDLTIARKDSSSVAASASTLWTELSTTGALNLTPDRLSADLTAAQGIQKSEADALGHVQAAQSDITQAQAIPFQLHAPAFLSDGASLSHLSKSLAAAGNLALAATLQITIAQHMNQDSTTLAGLNASMNNKDWTTASKTAASLTTDVKAQQAAVADPEALMDPLWSKWMDGIITYAGAAQQYSLASATPGQKGAAQQFANQMAAANQQIRAALAAAQGDAAAWQTKTVQPILTTMTSELSAGS